MDDRNGMTSGLVLGADGCRGGWIVAVLDRGELMVERYETIGKLIAAYPAFDAFLIDMAVGLQDHAGQIRPDDLARKELRFRGSTVFPVPARAAVYAGSATEAREANKRVLGKSLSAQTVNLIPKIRELDEFLESHPEYKNRIDESHPELSFARLNGAVLLSRKKEQEGLDERREILLRYLPGAGLPDFREKARELACSPDDVADALCLAVAAFLKTQGLCERIPEDPDRDSHGLYMRLTVPRKDILRHIEDAAEDAAETAAAKQGGDQ